MQSVKEMRERYDQLGLEISALKGVRDTYVKSMQAACDHPKEQIVEGDSIECQWSNNHTPPFRVCKLCGYSEEGWGSGYRRLEGYNCGIPTIDSNKALCYMIGPMVKQDRCYSSDD